MEKKRPQTIQIFLPDGSPRSVRIAEITNRVVKAILVPKNKIDYIATRSEIRNVGVYFLFGEDGSAAKPVAYIGEAEDCLDRIKQHNRGKDFWSHAIVVVSRIGTFTKSHAKYLEYVALKEAFDVNRYELKNSANPAKPFVTESMEADLLDSFETIKILVSTLGYPVFDKESRETTPPEETFAINRRSIRAEGSLVDDGFVVFADSEANIRATPSCNRYVVDIRSKLIQSQVIVASNDKYLFKQDYIFNSPSTAAGVVLGSSANGWTEWRTASGATLDKIKRRQI